MNIAYDDPNLYLTYIYQDCDILTNVLRALAMFRGRVEPQIWPRQIVVRHNNRIPFTNLHNIEVVRDSKSLVDALYLSLYSPLHFEQDITRHKRKLPENLERTGVPGGRERKRKRS